MFIRQKDDNSKNSKYFLFSRPKGKNGTPFFAGCNLDLSLN